MSILNKTNNGLLYNKPDIVTDPPVKKQTSNYTLGWSQPFTDDKGTVTWKYGEPTFLEGMDEKTFGENRDRQARFLAVKKPLDRYYEEHNYETIPPDMVDSISPNYRKYRDEYYTPLKALGYDPNTLGFKEKSSGMTQGDRDAFGDINYKHYPKLTDRAFNQKKHEEWNKNNPGKPIPKKDFNTGATWNDDINNWQKK